MYPMRMIFSSLFLVLLAGAMASCGGGSESRDTATETTQSTSEPETEASSAYLQTLQMGDYSFEIVASDGKLTVTPSGLGATNEPLTASYEGEVTNAEIEDLNSDGFPEVVVYSFTQDDNRYGNVHAFSVNNGQSMSPVSFPDIRNNAEASAGYSGGDEFAIVETTLSRRFPITGQNAGTRQISYKLVDGEAMRQFVIDQISEY